MLNAAISRWYRVESTSLDAIGYDETTQTLGVRFKAGAEYRHGPVPPDVVVKLLFAPSIGRHYGREIRGQYASMRVTPQPATDGIVSTLALDGFQAMRRRVTGTDVQLFNAFDDALVARYVAGARAVLDGKVPEGWTVDAAFLAFADGVQKGARQRGVACAEPTWLEQALAASVDAGAAEKAS